MKKMTVNQKLKFVIQNMRIEFGTIFIYLAIALFIFVFFNIFNTSFLTYVIIVIILIILQFIFSMFESIGIILKKVDLVDGELYKSYDDSNYNTGIEGIGAQRTFEVKYISLFSDMVKSRRVIASGNARIKVQSQDGKYFSPWVLITKRIFNNKKKYRFMIIVYKNIPVSVYYQKNV